VYGFPCGQAVRHFDDGPFRIAIKQQVGPAVQQDGAAHLVAPVIVVGNPAQAGFDTADDEGHLAVGLPQALAVDDHSPVGSPVPKVVRCIGVVIAPFSVRRITVDHGIHIAGGHTEEKSRLAEHLEGERRQLEASSDTLRTLERQLYELETSIRETEAALDDNRSELGRTEEKLERARAELQDSQAQHAAADTDATRCFPLLADMRGQALGEHTLTVESCDNREKDLRDWLQRRIDTEAHSMERLAERIVKTMESYCNRYPVETQEADVSVGAAAEYRTMLDALASDDLPRFEARFKELLNENTIREVANFQSQLSRERQTIRERIETINRSLQAIDYNPGRYIVLEAQASADPDIRDFQRDLRACTEGALTGSEEEEYSEGKFLQVKRIIERFRGREGSTEVDRRWTRKVTDVRNAYMFSASERWREDNSEYEHYADSGGKSGGQKEKLAYTVLAASLAYQFGLEWGEIRSRSFRFVVIDEAFGRGSDESARYGLELFKRLNLQLLIVTPLQKIHIIEPYVASVGFVHSHDGQRSMLRNLTIEEYREERASRGQ